MIQSTSSTNFNPKTRFTKKGNHYQKTNALKVAGFVSAAGFAGISSIKPTKEAIKNIAENKDAILNTCLETLKGCFKTEDAEQISKIASKTVDSLPKAMKAGVALGAVACGLGGLLVGALGDKIINTVKAVKADKANKANNSK